MFAPQSHFYHTPISPVSFLLKYFSRIFLICQSQKHKINILDMYNINSFMTEFLSYRNQSIDFQSKSIDQFLYDRHSVMKELIMQKLLLISCCSFSFIYDSVLMRESAEQRKPIFWYILSSDSTLKILALVTSIIKYQCSKLVKNLSSSYHME